MKKLTNKVAIKNYENACNDIANLFADTYFEEPYMHWIGDSIGEVIGINDYFFNVDDILTYLKAKATKEEMFDYYDFIMTAHETGETKPSFRYWRDEIKQKPQEVL